MRWQKRWMVVGSAALHLACGGTRESASGRAGADTTHASAAPCMESSGGEQRTDQSHLVGQWVRYWSPSGFAQTPRYVFLADGRYVFRPGADTETAQTQRVGRYRVEHGDLVLAAKSAEDPHDAHGDEQRLALGPCPPNDEAKAIDARYACISVGGEAYFRCTGRGALSEQQLMLDEPSSQTSP